MTEPAFLSASAYQTNVLALPVTDLDTAANWYGNHFGMAEISRTETPVPTVILERDGCQIGFAINGGDASQDGAAIRVRDIEGIRRQLRETGLEIGEERVDDHDGEQLRVFFVVAPDGLCFYFNEPVNGG